MRAGQRRKGCTMRIVNRLMAAISCVLACLYAAPVKAEKRLALTVGIDAYDNLPPHEQLRKAVSDARAVGATLHELGFETMVEENVARLAFARAWHRLLNRLEPGDTAALFFAGHGVVLSGVNYLLPRDVPTAAPGEEKVLAGALIRLTDLMDDLREKKVRVALFIVDACRENPFRNARGRGPVGGVRGLTRIREEIKGSFILYSAGYGERALDRLSEADAEPNSPYTRTLIPILKTPGLSLQQIATRVRAGVLELTKKAQPPHEQTPAYYDQLAGEFVLNPGPAESKPPKVAGPHGGASPSATPLAAVGESALKPNGSFKDCDTCPDMLVVPAGSFMMGSPDEEPGRRKIEGPVRAVEFRKPFAAARYALTRDQ